MSFPGKKIPTVKISSDNHEAAFVIINKADFDESKHNLFEKKEKSKDAENGEEVKFITEAEAQAMNRDELRGYAKKFDITGRTYEEIFAALKEAGKFFQDEVE